MSNMSSAIKMANELSEKANILSDKLKDIAFTNAEAAATDTTIVYAITIFTLACFVGYYVVWKVTPALHTPLMSVTNAISGIIVIGALVASASEMFDASSFLGFISVFFASINIFGGFIVTQRMLSMFKKK
ncbi:MAG: NAD(P) transhydrogenase subunit alpha [Rickettsiaceae bacterium]|nr:NAD(P) transhydrogenase subunit alpha [Rickettsiaceae bacterium]